MPRPLAEKRVYVPRGKNRIVYVFNTSFEKIDEGHSAEIINKYEIKQLRAYISREDLAYGKWYFSLTDTIPNKDGKRIKTQAAKNVCKKNLWSCKRSLKKTMKKKEEFLKQFDINYEPPKLSNPSPENEQK